MTKFYLYFKKSRPLACRHNIQYGEPRDVKNRGFTANLDKRQAAELPQTKETHQWKV